MTCSGTHRSQPKGGNHRGYAVKRKVAYRPRLLALGISHGCIQSVRLGSRRHPVIACSSRRDQPVHSSALNFCDVNHAFAIRV